MRQGGGLAPSYKERASHESCGRALARSLLRWRGSRYVLRVQRGCGGRALRLRCGGGACSRFCVEDSALHVTLRRIPALSPRWTGFGCSDPVGARPHSAYPRARSGCKAGFGHLLKMCKQKNLPGGCPKSGVSATAPRKRHNRDWFQLIPTKLSDMLALRSGATRPQIRAWRYTQPQCRG